MKNYLILGITFLVSLSLNAQMNWPLMSLTSQHNITGTVGEFRTSYSNPRFHLGLDMTNGSDHSVYAIESGTAIYYPEGKNSYLKITNENGSILYIHVTSSVSNGPVSAGQLIGAMVDQSAIHLHLQNSNYNFLSSNLFPFTDNTPPTIATVKFRQNGHKYSTITAPFTTQININGINYTLIYNKIDIETKVSGPGVSPTGSANGNTVAPYSISYDILDFSNNSIFNGPIEHIKFETIPNNSAAQYVFGNGTSFSPAIYNYILTSHPNVQPYDRYWNTALRNGLTETWPNNTSLDARSNDEALSPDGQYVIKVYARDIDYYQNPSLLTEQTNYILIDNFRPYIKKVDMFSGTMIYSAMWFWDESNAQLTFLPNTLSGVASGSNNLTIRITASEPLKSLTLSIPSINFLSTSILPLPSTNNKQWEFTIPTATISSANSCNHSLLISGYDLNNNPIQSNPAIISIRNLNGAWNPAPVPGNDSYHSFMTGNGFQITLSSTDATPPDFNNGTATVWALGAQSFLWSNGQTSSTISNLVPGTYSVTVTSSMGCIATGSVIVLNSLFPTFCSGLTTLTTPSGTFSDGSGSNDYGNNSNCSWLIQPINATSISLSFSSFSTEYLHDFVTVYNGSNNSCPVLGVFSGSSIPPLLETTGGSLFLTFTSDYVITKPGWVANYSSNIDSIFCLTPVSQYVQNISGYSASLSCSPVPNALSYIFRYRDLDSNSWVVSSSFNPNLSLMNLYPCKTYESEVAAKCSLADTSAFSPSMIFSTLGCDTTNEGSNIVAFQYWFDSNYMNNNYVPVSYQNTLHLTQNLSTSNLADGLHSLHMRFLDDNGNWSSIASDMFFKKPVSSFDERKITVFEYWFDNSYAEKFYQSVSPQATLLLNSPLNSNALSPGLHSFHIRYKDDGGQWSSVTSDVFHKFASAPAGQRKLVGYEYWFDNNYGAKESQSISGQQISFLNTALSTSALPLGLHNFHIRYKDDAGQWSSIGSDAIFKVGVVTSQNNRISAYRYWFDMNFSTMVSQSLPTPVNPYQLLQNIYVGNLSVGDHSIHFQFKDVAGQWSSVVSGAFTFAGPDEQTSITSQTIANGQINCFDALQKITVAGNGATFIIQTGGSATMVAGQNIVFFSTSMVQTGGYLHAYIAPSGPWCQTSSMPTVLKAYENEISPVISNSSFFRVYPNPTSGNFVLEFFEDNQDNTIIVDIFDFLGEPVLKGVLITDRKHEFSLSERPTGVYLIRALSGKKCVTAKVIKQ